MLRGWITWRSPAGRSGAAALAAVAGLGLAAPPAAAHIRPSGQWVPVASDYRAVVVSGPQRARISARVLHGDQSLRLHVGSGAVVVVLGYAGEPFLRFARGEVDVNESAATAYAAGLGRRGGTPAVDPGAPPSWRRIAGGAAYAWHDHRLRPPALRLRPFRRTAAWSVPLRVDGAPARIGGRTTHAAGPSLQPWLLLGAALVALGAALALLPRPALRRAGAAGLAAGSLTLLVAAATAAWLDTPRATGDRVVLFVSAAVLIAVAVAVLVLADGAAAAPVTLAVAALASAAAATFAPVFTHGFPLSALPATVARLAVCGALGLGLAASIVAGADVARLVRARQTASGVNEA